MHLLPQLRKLERQFSDSLTVLGIHSAKFTNERDDESLRRAVLRYGIEHPVANDRAFAVWHSYAVRAWPTLMFIDPRGYVLAKHEGEVPYDALAGVAGEMLADFESRGLLQRRVISFPLDRERAQDRPLAFPGKVLADGPSGRLFVADSNHNRLVVADYAGRVQAVVGSGEAGLEDGPFEAARFHGPQGLALAGESLYVADTAGHAVRRVDLAARRVETIAGTGEQGVGTASVGSGVETPLNSPWDVAVDGRTLYIAMAGRHQVWALDLESGEVRPFAGAGHEGLVDGTLMEAWFAQPSGLALDGRTLYVADSETSAIRAVGLDAAGRVRTLVGQDLFVFGDADGARAEARLQHPLGICAAGGALFVADTYNHKVKRLDTASGTVETVAGAGEHGRRDGAPAQARFFEPGGLSVAGRRLYVADTNNHAVRIVELTAQTVSTLDFSGL